VTQKPQRVVSLVPAVAEIIFQLGAGETLKGLTYHDADLPEANQKEIVGGFLTPSPAQVEARDPDMIFLSSLHQEVRERFSDGRCRMLAMESRSIKDLYDNVRLLGMIFQREQAAEEIVRNINDSLQLISKKIDKIPHDKRRRVMRFMGRDRVMTPGDD
jgi:iron complex transport system substrate-binding protein